MVNGSRFYRALESVSIASALSTALTHARAESINAYSKSPTSCSSEEGVAAGHSEQFTLGGYLSTVKHTTLAGIEPTTFRLLVRRATSSATETTTCNMESRSGARLPQLSLTLYVQPIPGPEKRVSRVQPDDYGWQQGEYKLQNGQMNTLFVI